MSVPKWLIPVISVVAAAALGVSMAFVGANFASTRVIEKAAGTVTAQVVQPVATGLTNADVAAMSSSYHGGASPVTGTVSVAKPGAQSIKPPLDREVDLIASGHGSADGPSTASSPTPSPTTPPDSSTIGVSAYVPSPPLPAASDPCAASGSVPAGCPDGLHSVILALTAPPAPDFTAVPFAYPCTARPAPTSVADRANVDVTLTSSVPMSFSVHYQSTPPVGSTSTAVPRGIVSFTTPSVETNVWNAARSRDVAVAELPKLYTCATIPNVWQDGALTVDITGTATDGTVVIHHLAFNPSGPGAPGPLRVQVFGSDAFVAYGERPVNQTLRIHAYTMTHPTDATCDDVRALQVLSPVYSTTGTLSSADDAELNVPSDFTQRTAVGFRLPAGSVVLLCAYWFPGTGAPSFDREYSLRSSQIVVESPELVGSVKIWDVVRDPNHGGENQLRGDIARVHAFATLDDGSSCGDPFDWFKGQPAGPEPDGVSNNGLTVVCTAPSNESLDATTGFTDTPPADLHVNLTVQVIGTTGGRAHQTFQLTLHEPTVCATCVVTHDSGLNAQDYRLHLPDPYSNPLDQPGGIRAVSEWEYTGTSNTQTWVVSDAVAGGADETPLVIDSPPRFNTDNRLTIDTALTTPTDVTAMLNFEADRAGAYRLSLHSPSGGAPCTVNGATSVVVGGLYPTARAIVPILIPHLCHGAAYVAALESIDGTNYTDLSDEAYGGYGYGYTGSGWLGWLLGTPQVMVHVQYSETVPVAVGSALTDLDLQLDGGDVHPLTDLFAGCASTPFTNSGTTTMALGSQVQLHLHYRVRHVTSQPGHPCTFPTVDVAPAIDAYRTIDLNSVMANPLGVQVTSGPYTVILKITPVS